MENVRSISPNDEEFYFCYSYGHAVLHQKKDGTKIHIGILKNIKLSGLVLTKGNLGWFLIPIDQFKNNAPSEEVLKCIGGLPEYKENIPQIKTERKLTFGEQEEKIGWHLYQRKWLVLSKKIGTRPVKDRLHILIELIGKVSNSYKYLDVYLEEDKDEEFKFKSIQCNKDWKPITNSIEVGDIIAYEHVPGPIAKTCDICQRQDIIYQKIGFKESCIVSDIDCGWVIGNNRVGANTSFNMADVIIWEHIKGSKIKKK